ncbi:uncharacterized protein LOC130817435 [Amaranthus tricolor]|uniref:uncharacterized protein LOC130817435 n=1 Tax=Amaranthus tricolor TaxID=29722 RepID=UPI0025896C71|nr:uncharacterized protein LOC130817435 [Amaranthus tricolor]
MEIDRPHRTVSTPTTTGELFICFTSRLSKSSSMCHSSKSILSPNRITTADKTTQPAALSTSLSRRLRHNGSLRGAQSPAMFPSKKTRGSSGFADNPEPSSPKVTCIGQVRVKTKKQGKKMKMKACRSKRLSGGEPSFRCIEHPHEGLSQGIQSQQSQECGLNHRNQRWVHLPLTICEALRTFGNEFSCLFPCKSSCFSNCGGEKGDKIGEDGESSSNSCAVFRWLVSLQESESEKKRRDIELVVGGGEEVEGEVRGESIMMERECSRRRSIFDDMEFDDLFNNMKNEGEICDSGGDNEEGARVSVCIPPKNALLLMRCRSNPMKMASLSHKFWDVPLPTKDDDDDDDHGNDDKGEECEMKDVELEENIEVRGYDNEENVEQSDKFDEMLDFYLQNLPNYIEDDELNPQEIRCEILEKTHVEKDENLENGSINESIIVENKGENGQNEQDLSIILETHVVKDENLENGSTNESLIDENKVENGQNEQDLSINLEKNQQEENSNNGCSNQSLLDHDHDSTLDGEDRSDLSSTTTSSSSSNSSEEDEKQEKNPEENNKKTLPDCLLLMMCEPKVSMEVSKETWVCSTDFIRWLPDRQVKKDLSKKKPTPVERSIQRFEPASQPPVQPARSSISFPARGNLVVKGGAGSGFEPLMLTRCKSAPMRSAPAKITPTEMKCSLWGKLEPHRPATFGF